MFQAVYIHFANMDEFVRDWRGAMQNIVFGIQVGVERGVVEGEREALATRRWKDRTGEAHRQLRGYLLARTADGGYGMLECRVDYASYLEFGTEPHEIWPKAAHGTPAHALKPGQTVRASGFGPHEHIVGRGRFLRWRGSDGQTHFASMVHHPGTAADGFFARGILKAEETILTEVRNIIPVVQRRWLEAG